MQELDRIYRDNFIKVYRYILSMSGDPHLAEDITQETFFRALQRLDEPYKEVFSLRTFSELSFKEIGNMFGKNDNWARVIYHRAKLKVKEELKDEY